MMKKKFCLVLMVLSLTKLSYATTLVGIPLNGEVVVTFDDDNEGPPVEDPPPPVPIDSCIPFLMLTGLAFVAFKLNKWKES